MPPGVRIGSYEVLRMIAVGGMAELFLARASNGQVVALKQILPQLEESDEYVRMFADEARLAAALRHPNIAEVFEIGNADGRTFYTMEYLEGRDVRDIQRRASGRGGVPLAYAIAIVNGVCAALHYAHEVKGEDGRPLGIVHRDVTPGNVLVTFGGRVKLLDFGVAKAHGRQTETRAGMIKGKIAYMSPEQCRAQPVDRRSDVFALGILLYELTTGTRMLRAASDFDMLQKLARAEIDPPSRRRQGYPVLLEGIVMRALERDPDDRYQTAQELQLDLLELVAEMKLDASGPALEQYMQTLFPPTPDHDQTAARFEQIADEELFGPPRDLSAAPKPVPAQGSGRVGAGPSVIVAEDTGDAPDLTALVVEIEAESASSIQPQPQPRPSAPVPAPIQVRLPTPMPVAAPVRLPAATPMPARVPLPARLLGLAEPRASRETKPAAGTSEPTTPTAVPAPARTTPSQATPSPAGDLEIRWSNPALAKPAPAAMSAQSKPAPAAARPMAHSGPAGLAIATAFAAAALALVILALLALYTPSSIPAAAPAARPPAAPTAR